MTAVVGILIKLIPNLTELKVFDNTAENDPKKGKTPVPKLLCTGFTAESWRKHDLRQMPEWARPIVQAAIESPKRVGIVPARSNRFPQALPRDRACFASANRRKNRCGVARQVG